MTDNELLLAMSEMMDKKLNPLKNDIKDIKITLKNDMLPRLQNIESCYTSTYRRYQSATNQIKSMEADIEIIKKVIQEHSKKTTKIS